MSEFPATSAVLNAAAFVIGDACQEANDNYMLCKNRSDDPAICLPYALNIQSCTNHFFTKLGSSPCQKMFENYWKCLDMNNQDYVYCRDEEKLFHQCAGEKLGWKKKLWKKQGPEGGLKPEGHMPGSDSLPYRYHVWSHKHEYDPK